MKTAYPALPVPRMIKDTNNHFRNRFASNGDPRFFRDVTEKSTHGTFVGKITTHETTRKEAIIDPSRLVK